jgi:hypothetical protein
MTNLASENLNLLGNITIEPLSDSVLDSLADGGQSKAWPLCSIVVCSILRAYSEQ